MDVGMEKKGRKPQAGWKLFLWCNHPHMAVKYFQGDSYIQSAIVDGVSRLNAALTALSRKGIEMI